MIITKSGKIHELLPAEALPAGDVPRAHERSERVIDHSAARAKLRDRIARRDADKTQRAADARLIAQKRSEVQKAKLVLTRANADDLRSTKEKRHAIEEAERALQDATDDLTDVERILPMLSEGAAEMHSLNIKMAIVDVLRSSPEAAELCRRYEGTITYLKKIRPVIAMLDRGDLLAMERDEDHTLLMEWRAAARQLEENPDAVLPK